jgi:hypothetical protein
MQSLKILEDLTPGNLNGATLLTVFTVMSEKEVGLKELASRVLVISLGRFPTELPPVSSKCEGLYCVGCVNPLINQMKGYWAKGQPVQSQAKYRSLCDSV